MRYTYSFLLSCLVGAGSVDGQDCQQSRAFEVFHANDIRALISNGGDLFSDLQNNRFQVPFTGPGSPGMIFAAGTWLGAMDPNGNLMIAAQEFRYGGRNDYAPGPLDLDGATNPGMCERWDKIWKVTRHDILSHQQDYLDNQFIDQPVHSIYSWPGSGNVHFSGYNGFELPALPDLSAPFHDANANGLYEPHLGEYPLPEGVDPSVIPMVITWSVYNDAGVTHSNSLGVPLQAEVQLTTYAFHCDSGSRLNQTLFTSYRIVNRSQSSLDSLIFGQWMDPDLGCFLDDYFGSYPAGNALFVYNTDPVDGYPGENCEGGISTYGAYPPVLSVVFLNRPMTSAMYYMNSSLWSGPVGMVEPQIAPEYYELLNGRWRDGHPMSSTAYGYEIPPADTTTFAFHDDPNDPDGWSLYNEDIFGDRRIIGGSRLGRLEPGASTTIDLAFGHHLDSTLNHV
ncbi:MAG: hypothetical protein R3330_12715, partial [Saprospiraceae bacterium]|nr:hypothetical protein [Saprospiraceae bacterium]